MHNSDPLRRRNHFVPATYLSAFTPERTRDGLLWVYERGGDSRPRQLRASSVALEKDLYTRRDEAGQLTDEVERLYATHVEAPFARVRDDLVYGSEVGVVPSLERLGEESRLALARFFAHQLLRTPTERHASRWLASISSRLFAREQLAPGGILRALLRQISGAELTEEQVAAAREWYLALPAIGAMKEDWLPRTLRNAERLTSLLTEMEWSLVVVPPDISLPTCDMPLVCVRRDRETGEIRLGGGVQEPGFEASLALSPRYCVVVRQRPWARLGSAADVGREVRRRTLAYARRWVYSGRVDPCIADALRQGRAPTYQIVVGARVFEAGHPAEEVEQAIIEAGVESFHFRYGTTSGGE